jgi:hypothetical protein
VGEHRSPPSTTSKARSRRWTVQPPARAPLFFGITAADVLVEVANQTVDLTMPGTGFRREKMPTDRG